MRNGFYAPVRMIIENGKVKSVEEELEDMQDLAVGRIAERLIDFAHEGEGQ